MPRRSRIISSTGIYHVMLRGINREMFFHDEDDYAIFLKALIDSNRESSFELYCYCLMGNHIHLLIRPLSDTLPVVMKRICCRFVYRYNRKHHRTGHLFQDRFKSEPVESDEYLKTVLRYILQNPVKAGLCNNAAAYRWSSYHALTGNNDAITYADFAEKLFGSSSNAADFLNAPAHDEALDMDDYPDEQVSLPAGKPPHPPKSSYEKQRLVSELSTQGLSVRKISEITGISKSSVQRIMNT